jgi:phosphoesterase RecJ-like protein
VILESRIINAARVFADGKAVLSVVTKKMLAESGALAEDADGVVEKLRDLKGVEVAVIIKENNGEFKVSIRTKQWVNAAAISEKRGGGGHMRAAGYSVKKSLAKVKDEIIAEIERSLNENQ